MTMNQNSDFLVKNEYTAIVTDVHYRMSLAIIRDLAEAGVNVIGVEFNRNEPPLGFYSKYVSEIHMMDKEEYIEELYDLCSKKFQENETKPVLICVGTATMNLFTDEIRNRFSFVAGCILPSLEHLNLLNDKKQMTDFASSCGVPIPKEYKAPYDDVTFPCVVKPLCGEKHGLKARDRYRIVNNEKELEDAVMHFTSISKSENPIVQQYISGSGFGCEFFAKDGEILSHICHERLREYPISGGPSACCRSVHLPKLLEYSKTMCRKLNLSGVAMFEFKQDRNGEFYLLECNPRVWGTYPLTRASKSNLSLCWFKTAFEAANPGNQFDAHGNDYRDVKMHFLFSDIASGFSYLRSGKIFKGLSGVFSFLNPTLKNGLFELKDIKPALKYLKNKL